MAYGYVDPAGGEAPTRRGYNVPRGISYPRASYGMVGPGRGPIFGPRQPPATVSPIPTGRGGLPIRPGFYGPAPVTPISPGRIPIGVRPGPTTSPVSPEDIPPANRFPMPRPQPPLSPRVPPMITPEMGMPPIRPTSGVPLGPPPPLQPILPPDLLGPIWNPPPQGDPTDFLRQALMRRFMRG